MPEDTAIDGAGLSFVGNYREDNQDAIRLHTAVSETAYSRHGYLWGIADGMGGCDHGGIASTLALDTLFTAYYSDTGGKPQSALKSAIQQANVAVQREADRLCSVRMGTTLSSASIIGNQLVIAHIGDSRVYLIRDGKSICLTDDHTQVGDLVRMKLLTPDKIRTHDRRSVLNRAIGIQIIVQPDITQHTLQPEDYLVLCTDGVWSVVQDAEFGQIALDERDPARINERLVAEAMQRDSDDNASVITVHVRAVPEQAQTASAGKSWSLGKLFNRRGLAGA